MNSIAEELGFVSWLEQVILLFFIVSRCSEAHPIACPIFTWISFPKSKAAKT
jgi:hypothetical protein